MKKLLVVVPALIASVACRGPETGFMPYPTVSMKATPEAVSTKIANEWDAALRAAIAKSNGSTNQPFSMRLMAKSNSAVMIEVTGFASVPMIHSFTITAGSDGTVTVIPSVEMVVSGNRTQVKLSSRDNALRDALQDALLEIRRRVEG